MTYCVGILVREGLVMIADTRTNAGVDNIATFRKLHMFERPGERSIGLCTAGNLSVSQSVVSHVVEGVENPATGEVETIMTVPTLFRAAQLVGQFLSGLGGFDLLATLAVLGTFALMAAVAAGAPLTRILHLRPSDALRSE